MMTPFRTLSLMLLFGCLPALIPTLASAEQKVDFGDYQVHYNAFASSFLKPDIARQYELQRSRALGVVNISVLHKTPAGMVPVAAQVEGGMLNNVRQRFLLPFHRVTEGKAIYSLAQFQYSDGEMLIFEISVLPEGQQQALPIRFSQQLFSE